MLSDFIIGFDVAIDSFSAIICLLLIFSIKISTTKKSRSSFWFSLTCFSCFILSISDLLTWISEGTDSQAKIIGLPIAHFVYYYFGCFIFVCYLKYIIELLSEKVKINKGFWYSILSLFLIYVTGLIITQFNGLYYIINDENKYVRSSGFWVPTCIDGICYVETLYLLFRYKKHLSRGHLFALISSIIIPSVMQSVQNLYYGLALNCCGISISFLIIFINNQQLLQNSLSETDRELQEKNETIGLIQDNTIVSLANLVENRASERNHHISRIRYYIRIIADQCKEDQIFPDTINDEYIELLVKAAPMHDIGKIIIPDKILKKPGRLTRDEFDVVKKHSAEGARIINEVLKNGLDASYLKIATEISTSHHEKWDGTGYPNQLKGEYIPLSARIVAIADVFDALVSKRCYKETTPIEIAFTIIKDGSGTSFDPILVREFIKAKEKITNIAENFDD